MNLSMFEKYESKIAAYQGNPQAKSLLIAEEGVLSVHYAPFEWINPDARLVLVGITPGKVQAHDALREAQRAIMEGVSAAEVIQRAKRIGAFSGATRKNLIHLLDRIGIQKWLQLRSCGELFEGARHLLQTTSVLQYPVFAAGENYNGKPSPLKHPLLRQMLLKHFSALAKALPHAVFVPLGPVPSEALSWLVSQGVLTPLRVLEGLPHPSGANAERIAYFLGKKERHHLSVKTDPVKIDVMRQRLTLAVEGFANAESRDGLRWSSGALQRIEQTGTPD